MKKETTRKKSAEESPLEAEAEAPSETVTVTNNTHQALDVLGRVIPAKGTAQYKNFDPSGSLLVTRWIAAKVLSVG